MKEIKDLSESPRKKYNPKDREGGFPLGISNFRKRFFEILPGFLLWFLLLLPFLFALLKWNIAFIIYLSFLVSYWLFRGARFVIGISIGIKRMNEAVATDWVKKIGNLKNKKYNNLKFVYLCPVYGEEYDVLSSSFEAWSKSDIGAEKIDVVMAIEERKMDLQIANFKKLQEKYGDKFDSMRYYIHPQGIEGEIAGVKGANINWAARHFIEDLRKEGKDTKNYLLITCDSDLRPHHKYLSSVMYKYLTVKNPERTYFTSAIYTYNNNIWRVAPLVRAQSNILTLVILYAWALDKSVKVPFSNDRLYTRDTFSSYIVNLHSLEEIEFWDPEIPNDDTAFYWNSILRSKGEFKGEEVYVPTYSDAVEGDTFIKSHISFYKQQYRWGWGNITLPISLAVLAEKDDNFPIYKKLYLLAIMGEHLWLMTVVFVLTFGLNLIPLLNPEYQYTVFSYNFPKIVSYVLSVVTLFNIPIVIFRRKITPVPKNWKWWRHILDFLETFLVSVNMLTFSFIPYVQAITEMMLGLGKFRRNFYVTQKYRKKE